MIKVIHQLRLAIASGTRLCCLSHIRMRLDESFNIASVLHLYIREEYLTGVGLCGVFDALTPHFYVVGNFRFYPDKSY